MKRSLIYKAIRDKGRELAYLKSTDLQKGQFQTQANNIPVPMPALLIEISDFRFTSKAEHNQIGTGLISLYLYLPLVTETFKGAEREDDSILLLDRFDDIFQTFEGLCIQGITPLVRVAESKPQYGTRLIWFKVDFSTSVDSDFIANNKTVSKPDPDIAPVFKFKKNG